MATIRCHTVPQFYLNYFLQPGSNLFWVYDKKDADERQQTPVNTTVIGDYYLSEPDESGKKDTRFEEFLSVIEGWGRDILDRLIKNPETLKDEDKGPLGMFLSFMHCRSPRAVAAVKEMQTAHVEYVYGQIVKLDANSGRLKDLYEKFSKEAGAEIHYSYEEFIEVLKNEVSVEVNEKHAVGESFSTTETIQNRLMNMYWHICVAPKKKYFVTSDAPVTVFTPYPDGRVIFGGGFAMASVLVTFPISPRLCLYLSYKPFIGKVDHLDTHQVDEINRRTIYMAERFVISPFCSTRIKSLIKRYSSSYGAPKINAEELKKRLKDSGFGLK